MSTEVVALAGGILFILVALVGGGIAIREISVPMVPRWARVASAVFGILLLLPFHAHAVPRRRRQIALPPGVVFSDPPSSQQQGGSGLELDTEPTVTSDNIQLSNLSASVRNVPPRVGDTLTVGYSLTNVGPSPVRLDYTFVGARNPADENKDAEDENEGRTLASGETTRAGGRIFLDSPGTWTVWPCYVLTGDRFCPDQWKAFSFIVA